MSEGTEQLEATKADFMKMEKETLAVLLTGLIALNAQYAPHVNLMLAGLIAKKSSEKNGS